MGVRVKFGTDEIKKEELVGQSVENAIDMIRDYGVFASIPNDVKADVNNEPVEDDYELEDGDVLHLRKKAGEKGASA